MGHPAPRGDQGNEPLRIRRAEDDDAAAERMQAAGAEAGAVPIGDLGLEAADLAVDAIADRERRKAAIRARLAGVCPALEDPRSRWVLDRTAEIVADGGADPACLDRALRDYLAMRERLGSEMRNPAGYLQKLLGKHFGAMWRTWPKPDR